VNDLFNRLLDGELSDYEFHREYERTRTSYSRHTVTGNCWKVLLDRGLDVFQQYEINDAFTFSTRMQE
jgi:ATP-dependent Lon protease